LDIRCESSNGLTSTDISSSDEFIVEVEEVLFEVEEVLVEEVEEVLVEEVEEVLVEEVEEVVLESKRPLSRIGVHVQADMSNIQGHHHIPVP